MNIDLYYTPSLSNVVNKSLTLRTSNASAKFLDPYDEYMPIVRLRGRCNFDDVNYVCIKETGANAFERYYFLEDVTIKSPQIAIMRLRLDVLMTYKTFIKSLHCYLKRSDSNGNGYLPDSRPQLIYNNVEKLSFYDADNKIEGFVVPGETMQMQKD